MLKLTEQISRSKEFHPVVHKPPEKSPWKGILTSHGYSHLTWAFSLHYMQDHILRDHGVSPPPSEKSPSMNILTMCGHVHLTWTFSSHAGIFTPCGNSHLIWPFSLHYMQDHILRDHGVSLPPSEKSPSMNILTMCGHVHLTWSFQSHVGIFTPCGNSHLIWPFSPHYMQDHILRYVWGVSSTIWKVT